LDSDSVEQNDARDCYNGDGATCGVYGTTVVRWRTILPQLEDTVAVGELRSGSGKRLSEAEQILSYGGVPGAVTGQGGVIPSLGFEVPFDEELVKIVSAGGCPARLVPRQRKVALRPPDEGPGGQQQHDHGAQGETIRGVERNGGSIPVVGATRLW
jgi:hypothetical protein